MSTLRSVAAIIVLLVTAQPSVMLSLILAKFGSLSGVATRSIAGSTMTKVLIMLLFGSTSLLAVATVTSLGYMPICVARRLSVSIRSAPLLRSDILQSTLPAPVLQIPSWPVAPRNARLGSSVTLTELVPATPAPILTTLT